MKQEHDKFIVNVLVGNFCECEGLEWEHAIVEDWKRKIVQRRKD